MQLDASISTNFKDTPSVLYGGVGVSWRYDGNYKEIRINKVKGASKTNANKR